MNTLGSGAAKASPAPLRDAILRCHDWFDFIDPPIYLYVDPAQSAPLDREDAWLREVASAAR